MRVVDRNAVVLRARALRRSATLPEGLLWQVLRKRPQNLKFRRQHPLGPFVVDFYCAAARLVVEVDGASHDMGDRPSCDARRDAWLREQGLRVLRFNATEVMNDLESVMTEIHRAARRRLPLHQAPPGPPPHASVGRN
jgi:very-short-patch-repair endonuclease